MSEAFLGAEEGEGERRAPNEFIVLLLLSAACAMSVGSGVDEPLAASDLAFHGLPWFPVSGRLGVEAEGSVALLACAPARVELGPAPDVDCRRTTRGPGLNVGDVDSGGAGGGGGGGGGGIVAAGAGLATNSAATATAIGGTSTWASSTGDVGTEVALPSSFPSL